MNLPPHRWRRRRRRRRRVKNGPMKEKVKMPRIDHGPNQSNAGLTHRSFLSGRSMILKRKWRRLRTSAGTHTHTHTQKYKKIWNYSRHISRSRRIKDVSLPLCQQWHLSDIDDDEFSIENVLKIWLKRELDTKNLRARSNERLKYLEVTTCRNIFHLEADNRYALRRAAWGGVA